MPLKLLFVSSRYLDRLSRYERSKFYNGRAFKKTVAKITNELATH